MSLVLFDGHCGLCSRFVQMIVKRDAERVFQFIPLQMYEGKLDDYNSVVLVEPSGETYVRSRAILRIFERLGYRWTVRLLSLIPVFIADAAYRLMAKHRLLLFGRTGACRLPDR